MRIEIKASVPEGFPLINFSASQIIQRVDSGYSNDKDHVFLVGRNCGANQYIYYRLSDGVVFTADKFQTCARFLCVGAMNLVY